MARATVAAAVLATAPAAEGFTATEATFTMKFSGVYSAEYVTEVTPKPGCGARRGKSVKSQKATIDTTQRVRIQRRRTATGLEFVFFPVGRAGSARPFPVTIDLRESQHDMFEDTSRNDREIEDKDGQRIGCEQGAFAPVPDEFGQDHRCLLKGMLIPIEESGKVRAPFNWFRRNEKRCGFDDPDGYPGRTNFLPLRAAASQSSLYRRRLNTLKADDRDIDVARSADNQGNAKVTTETNEAKWTMKLTRLTPWRPLRR